MADSPTPTSTRASFLRLPATSIGYVAIVAALLTAVIHLLLGMRVMGFSQTLGILFVLNGLGFLGGTGLYLSRYWRKALYLVAAGYAVVTVVAFFAMQGFGAEAFYARGQLNPFAVVAKAAELLVAGVALSLYAES